MTLQEVSDKSGVSIGLISAVERSLRFPKRANRIKIAQALGVDEEVFSILWEWGEQIKGAEDSE